jgi:uncharacterized protein (TIGR02145 family)
MMKKTYCMLALVLLSTFNLLYAQVIPSVKIKGSSGVSRTWMTKNLNVSKFRNGNIIPEAKTRKEWEDFVKNKQAAWCYLNFNPSNGLKYGKIYNWYAIKDLRGLSPQGWHIPTKQELAELIAYGPSALKSTIGWDSYTTTSAVEDSRGLVVGYRNREWSGNGTNKTGFSGLPGGYAQEDGDFFSSSSGWWSSTELDPNEAYFGGMQSYYDKVKINLFQNDEQFVKGEIQGKLSIENYDGKISYFKGGKTIGIFPAFESRMIKIPAKDASVVANDNGEFKFKNIPTGKYRFEINFAGDNKTTLIEFNYDETKGLQKDLNRSSVLYLTSKDSESKIIPQEINYGFYVRCVKDLSPVQPVKK